MTDILDAAIRGSGAVHGNVQVFNPGRNGLEIVAQRGFDRDFLELFELVTPSGPSSSACARAFRYGKREMVADVRTDPEFAPYLGIARQNGFRAVQSTPVFLDGRESAGRGAGPGLAPGRLKVRPQRRPCQKTFQNQCHFRFCGRRPALSRD